MLEPQPRHCNTVQLPVGLLFGPVTGGDCGKCHAQLKGRVLQASALCDITEGVTFSGNPRVALLQGVAAALGGS